MKNKRGITLIALVITIVVLIILAAVAINLSLGNNGIFNRAKTGKELYQNAEEDERALTGVTNSIDGLVGGNRTTPGLAMCAPKIIVHAELPNTGSGTRATGTYRASSSSYNKTNATDISDYLDFTANTGWTFKKSGWYWIITSTRNEQANAYGYSSDYLIINSSDIFIGNAEVNKGIYYTAEDETSHTLWFNEGDVIDFKHVIGTSAGAYSGAHFYLYRLFE